MNRGSNWFFGSDAETKDFQGVAIIQPVLQWGPSAAGGGKVSTV
jgi:hypothetical protein